MLDTFLPAILENPQDDGPRLGYADWLDQRCDPRGEFIRVQCRLARLSVSRECLVELENRERELLHEFEHAWAREFLGLVDFWAFQRGFVEEIGVTAGQFLDHADTLFRLAPIQEAHFNRLGDRLAALAASPFLGRLRFVDLSSNRLEDIGVRLLAKSCQLSSIRGLNLNCAAAGNAAALALASSPHLQNLQELYLSNNRICDEGAAALAASPHLRSLTTLFLDGNPISGEGRRLATLRFGKGAQF